MTGGAEEINMSNGLILRLVYRHVDVLSSAMSPTKPYKVDLLNRTQEALGECWKTARTEPSWTMNSETDLA